MYVHSSNYLHSKFLRVNPVLKGLFELSELVEFEVLGSSSSTSINKQTISLLKVRTRKNISTVHVLFADLLIFKMNFKMFAPSPTQFLS